MDALKGLQQKISNLGQEGVCSCSPVAGEVGPAVKSWLLQAWSLEIIWPHKNLGTVAYTPNSGLGIQTEADSQDLLDSPIPTESVSSRFSKKSVSDSASLPLCLSLSLSFTHTHRKTICKLPQLLNARTNSTPGPFPRPVCTVLSGHVHTCLLWTWIHPPPSFSLSD